MATSAISGNGAGGIGASSASANDPLKGLGLDQFLKLMIAELQNQDPLNPMDNSQMLQQISQIREIGSTDKLTKTLDAVLMGQNLTSASSLIGKHVTGLDDNAKQVSGVVDRITLSDGVPKLHVGDQTVGLENLSEVLPVNNS